MTPSKATKIMSKSCILRHLIYIRGNSGVLNAGACCPRSDRRGVCSTREDSSGGYGPDDCRSNFNMDHAGARGGAWRSMIRLVLAAAMPRRWISRRASSPRQSKAKDLINSASPSDGLLISCWGLHQYCRGTTQKTVPESALLPDRLRFVNAIGRPGFCLLANSMETRITFILIICNSQRCLVDIHSLFATN